MVSQMREEDSVSEESTVIHDYNAALAAALASEVLFIEGASKQRHSENMFLQW